MSDHACFDCGHPVSRHSGQAEGTGCRDCGCRRWFNVYVAEDEEHSFAEAEIENAKKLFRDSYLYGTRFVDVTGKRIDPRSVSPSIAARAAPFKDIIDRQESRG